MLCLANDKTAEKKVDLACSRSWKCAESLHKKAKQFPDAQSGMGPPGKPDLGQHVLGQSLGGEHVSKTELKWWQM